MPIAIDFGTCNTVIARWRDGFRAAEMIRVDGLSRSFPFNAPGESRSREAFVIPSLIHYGEDTNLLLGQQVVEQGLSDHAATFRWLKLEMLRGSARCRRVNGNVLSMRQASTDLLRNVLAFAVGQAGGGERDLVLTAPIETFDGYQDWLIETAGLVFPGTVRCLDEATACILGYQHMVQDNEAYMVFDFGGGTLDVSIAKVPAGGAGSAPAKILGRAGEELGGGLIDQWMLEKMQLDSAVQDDDIAAIGVPLMAKVEEAKIALSSGRDKVDISQFNDRTGRSVSYSFTRARLTEVLKAHELPMLVSRTMSRALEAAQQNYGLLPSQIKAVLMVGGTSLLLGVPDIVRTVLPRVPLMHDQPFEAVAAGACRYAGEDLNPTLVHEYAIRSWNRTQMDYDWVSVIPRGTRYPTDRPVSGRYITTGVSESDVLGMVVWERSQMSFPESSWGVGSDGQLQKLDQGERRVTGERELNPQAREFIHADPPCSMTEGKRFIVAFGVDRNKRLTISIKDSRAGNKSYVLTTGGEKVALPVKDFPLLKL